MSLDVYVRELDEILDVILTDKPAGTYVDRQDLTAIEDRIKSAMTDIVDYAASEDEIFLRNKIDSLKAEFDSGNGFNSWRLPGLEVFVRRLQKAVKVFGKKLLDSSQTPNYIDIVDAKSDSVSGNSRSFETTTVVLRKDSVFIVHGHDETKIYEVKDLLKSLNLKPIVLRDQPNQGATIVEKF